MRIDRAPRSDTRIESETHVFITMDDGMGAHVAVVPCVETSISLDLSPKADNGITPHCQSIHVDKDERSDVDIITEFHLLRANVGQERQFRVSANLVTN